MRTRKLLIIAGCLVIANITGIGNALADSDKEVVIKGEGMSFSNTEVTAEAGSKLTIKLENVSDGMQHNLAVLSQGADVASVAKAATRAGADNAYVPDHEAVIANTGLVEGGESSSVTFTVPSEPGEYTYVCLFPGHYTQMKGTLTVTE